LVASHLTVSFIAVGGGEVGRAVLPESEAG
jgi:hypothetical protein